RVVGRREREPREAAAALAEAFARRERDAVLLEQALARQPVRQPQPDEERALGAGLAAGERGDGAVAAPLVGGAPRLDRFLRACERRDRRLLHRPEDARELMVLQVLDARRDLRVPEGEADPPARHAVRLRHREELEAHLARAVDRQEALGAAAVEDALAVRVQPGQTVALVPTLHHVQAVATTTPALARRGVLIQDQQAAGRADW